MRAALLAELRSSPRVVSSQVVSAWKSIGLLPGYVSPSALLEDEETRHGSGKAGSGPKRSRTQLYLGTAASYAAFSTCNHRSR